MSEIKDSESKPKRETRRILQRVYGRLLFETAQNITHSPPARLSALTGLNQSVMVRLSKGEDIKITISESDRSKILEALVDYYIKERKLPTTLQLFNACKDHLPAFMDIAGFRKLLFKYDFVWKKISGSFFVLERPEVTYERYMFLKAILVHADWDNVYFIEENGFSDEEDTMSYFNFNESLKSVCAKVIYAITNEKVILSNSFGVGYTERSFKNWIVSELLPTLTKPSVIVFNNAEHHCEMLPGSSDLTIESLRCEMTDWLDKNNIPYEQSLSKVELYSLIEKCTDLHSNKYVIDNIILASGHLPLRLPNHLISLTPGQHVCAFMKKILQSLTFKSLQNSKLESKVSDILISLGPEHMKKWCGQIYPAYKKMFDKDIQVDQVLDHYMSKMELDKLEEYADSDLPSLSEDSDS